MKKAILISSAALFACMLLFFACKKQTASFEPLDFDSYVKEFNVDKLPEEKGQVLKGKVHLNVTKEKFLVLWIEDKLQPNHVFFLQPFQIIAVRKSIENGQVLIMKNFFIINSLDNNENYVLKLPDAVLPE